MKMRIILLYICYLSLYFHIFIFLFILRFFFLFMFPNVLLIYLFFHLFLFILFFYRCIVFYGTPMTPYSHDAQLHFDDTFQQMCHVTPTVTCCCWARCPLHSWWTCPCWHLSPWQTAHNLACAPASPAVCMSTWTHKCAPVYTQKHVKKWTHCRIYCMHGYTNKCIDIFCIKYVIINICWSVKKKNLHAYSHIHTIQGLTVYLFFLFLGTRDHLWLTLSITHSFLTTMAVLSSFFPPLCWAYTWHNTDCVKTTQCHLVHIDFNPFWLCDVSVYMLIQCGYLCAIWSMMANSLHKGGLIPKDCLGLWKSKDTHHADVHTGWGWGIKVCYWVLPAQVSHRMHVSGVHWL